MMPDPEIDVPMPDETAIPPEALAESNALLKARRDEVDRQRTQLRHQAQAVMRASAGWGSVTTEPEWQKVCEEAREQYASGQFLLERLGAERHLDPVLMAVLLTIRQQLIEDTGAQGMHELMLVDMTVLSYYNALRVQGWVGDSAFWVEHELFGGESPTAKLEEQHGRRIEGLAAEERVKRISESLLPLLDRTNRMLVRNLRALRELRQGPVPAVAIGQAGQVNVAAAQTNSSGFGSPPADSRGAKTKRRRRQRVSQGELDSTPR